MAQSPHGRRRVSAVLSETQPLADLELDLLTQAMSRAYGVDVARLSRSQLQLAADGLMRRTGASSVAALIDRVLHDAEAREAALVAFYACESQLFEDVPFYRAFVDEVIPWLRTYPFANIWAAQCGSGGMVYALAILLEERGMYERTCIHATDADRMLVAHARQHAVSTFALEAGQAGYEAAGGHGRLADYFDVEGDRAVLKPKLARNVVWSHYELDAGRSFNEFNLILCRNVMPGRTRAVQRRIFRLLTDSLSVSGLLALGGDEHLDLLYSTRCYKRWGDRAGWYQRAC